MTKGEDQDDICEMRMTLGAIRLSSSDELMGLCRCAILCLDTSTTLFEFLFSRGPRSTCLIMFGVVILF